MKDIRNQTEKCVFLCMISEHLREKNLWKIDSLFHYVMELVVLNHYATERMK